MLGAKTNLQMQTSVEPIHPLGAIDIHGGPQHSLGETLRFAQIGSGHGKVRQRDLHVQRHGNHVADHHEAEPVPVGGKAVVQQAVAKPVPEKHQSANLEVAVPCCGALARPKSENQVLEGEEIEVEAAKQKHGVVEVVLVAHKELGKGVVRHVTVVVCREQALEELVADGKEWEVFDIRVMLGVVRDDVVDLESVSTGFDSSRPSLTLWLLFHQPRERPPRKLAMTMPRAVSTWKLWVIPMWPASWAENTSWCQKQPIKKPEVLYQPVLRAHMQAANKRAYRATSRAYAQ